MTGLFRPTRVILHCSATKDGLVVDWSAIRRFHVDQRGWKDIGYHFGIERIGDAYEVLMGRSLDEPGAHCQYQNYDSIGVCFVGEFDEHGPSREQWEKGLQLVTWLCRRHLIPPERVFGHNQFDRAKSCPGRAFELERFRVHLKERLSRNGG